MAQSDLEAANAALYKLGASKIGALADTTPEAKACNDRIDNLKKLLLRTHPWNFAIKRAYLTPTYVTITVVADNGSGLIRVTTGSVHGLETNDRATIELTTGFNGTWRVTKISTTVVDLQNSTYSTSMAVDATSKLTKAPGYDYTYLIALPSDCLRLLRISEEDETDWRVEGRTILTEANVLNIKYIYNVTDYTTMDIAFYDLLATLLAYDICIRLTQSDTLKNQLWQEYRMMASKARFQDATEDPAEKLTADEWVSSRFSSIDQRTDKVLAWWL